MHPINQLRREYGYYDNLYREMRLNDDETFFNFTRMSSSQFDTLLNLIQPAIQKFTNNAISPTCSLLLTLNYTMFLLNVLMRPFGLFVMFT